MTDLTKRLREKHLVHESCFAYEFPHRLYSGECCGCDNAPHCEHWEEIKDPYGTGDWDKITYEPKPKK